MIRKTILLVMLAAMSLTANAFSFDLDSIAERGKFPRFVVNTYRWGDRFFNGYDTTYVKGSGYKFNVKAVSDNWVDYYNFDLPYNMRMRMFSDPSTSIGVRLTYLAVSVGYDKNYSHMFGGKARTQYTFGFNCSLFTFNISYTDNAVGTRITRFGRRGNTFDPHISFDGVKAQAISADLAYYFNHKQYSYAAAYSFGRIQVHSGGSWFAGLAFQEQKYDFDFSSLPEYMKASFPSAWVGYKYQAYNRHYAIKAGYGYNWVFAPNWTLCVNEAPVIGLRKGIMDPNDSKHSFSLSNQFKASIIWNHKQWFAGAIGNINVGIIYDKDSTFENATINATLSVGYRFNLW